MAKMKPWTYSHLDAFETCPKRYYHTRVAYDVKEPESEHIKWGNSVHKAFEENVSLNKPFPEEMSAFSNIGRQLREMPGIKHCEMKMAIDRAFKPVEWFSKTAWSRGIADLLVETPKKVLLIDYKTGKRKVSEQLTLYALYAFATYPTVNEVESGFIWLKEKKIDKETYQRKDVPELWKPFLTRASKLERAFQEDQWPARPSGICRGWCPCTECPHWERKK